MAKQHKTLEALARRAMDTMDKRYSIKRDGVEVWAAEWKSDGIRRGLNIWHYGTLIAHFAGTESSYVVQLLYVYGESRSDADAINALCELIGEKRRFTFKPVNGGFQEVTA
jgi:hypothetical protein